VAPALAGDAAFGTFTLDPARSTGGEVCAVMTLEDLGSGKFQLTSVRVSAAGKTVRQNGIFAFDGGDHPVEGGSLAFLRVDPQRYVVVSKGTVQGTAMRTLSDDGTTLTETVDGTDDGDAFHAARVYVRGSGTCAP
jgi:hypothetical protein